MTLSVLEPQVQRAADGKLNLAEFIDIIRQSLPLAYDTVERLAQGLEAGAGVVIEAPLHMDAHLRDQLKSAFASTSMRTALERYFGIAELGFQLCHAVGAASIEGMRTERWHRFISMEWQILNQHPLLRDC